MPLHASFLAQDSKESEVMEKYNNTVEGGCHHLEVGKEKIIWFLLQGEVFNIETNEPNVDFNNPLANCCYALCGPSKFI